MSPIRKRGGSVILLVLCLTAVLGIILAGFLAVSNQSMKASHRTHLKEVSLKLAEMGLERSLDAFAGNTFTSSPWTISGRMAKITFTISSSHYASSGLTGTVNVRVDNYDAFQANGDWDDTTYFLNNEIVGLLPGIWYRSKTANNQGTPSPPSSNWTGIDPIDPGAQYWKWDASAPYHQGDVVHHSSRWYRSLQTNTNKQPGSTSGTNAWSAYPLARIQWAKARYNKDDIVYDRGVWYRCKNNLSADSDAPRTDTANWASAETTTWNESTLYSVGDYVSFGRVWYRCVTANSGRTPTNATYWVTTAPVVYAEGVVTLANGNKIRTQLRAVIDPIPLFPNAVAATSTVNFSSGGTIDSYDSAENPNPTSFTDFSDSAIVAGAGTSAAAVVLGNVQVKGYVAAPPGPTPPYAPWYSVGGTAAVTQGDGVVASPHPTAVNVDRARTSRSPFIPTPEILVPNKLNVDSSTALSDSDLTLGKPDDTTWRNYHAPGNLILKDSHTYTIDGPVRLILDGDLSITNGAKIEFSSSTTAKLEIYVAGKIELNDCVGIENRTKLPKNLVIYCKSSSYDSYVENVSAPFYGVMYFSDPDSGLAMKSSVPPFYGAISVGTFTTDASLVLHYDTTLRYTTFPGVQTTYGFLDWRELTEIKEQITLP